MSGLFLEVASTVLFVSFSLINYSMRTISLAAVFTLWPLLGEVTKVLLVGRLMTHYLCVLFQVVVGILLLATAIADKHIGYVLPTIVLVKH